MCQAQRPAGVTTAMALLATTTRTAASVLDMTMNYVRPDGTLVGAGAQIATGNTLPSGIWQSADGVYRAFGNGFDRMWTGATTLIALGTTASTCGNWTDPTQSGTGAGQQGYLAVADPRWWNFTANAACDPATGGGAMGGLYCVQTAP